MPMRLRCRNPLRIQSQYNRAMKTIENSFRFARSDIAKFRLKIIEHGSKHGWQSAVDAFGVSRASYFRWSKKYKEGQGKLVSLVPTKTRPKRVRSMTTDYRLVEFISSFRKQYGNIGSMKIKVFLDEYAQEQGIKSISCRTIDKIIKRRNLTERGGKPKRKQKWLHRSRSRYAPKVNRPGYLEVDSVIVQVVNERFYFICCIDIFTKLALVRKVKSLSSIHAKSCLVEFLETLPFQVNTVQTDNGSEFLHVFDDYLNEKGITHQFIYPRCPKINSVVERFNRTLKSEFLNRTDSLYYDIDRFNGKLTLWLDWYNTKRPHQALGYQSPQQFLQSKSLK